MNPPLSYVNLLFSHTNFYCMYTFNFRNLAIVFTLVGLMSTGFSQIAPKNYGDCSPEALLFALRNLEDQIATASSSPVVRTDYSLNAADAGVTDKVYMLYRCETLSDSIVALEARLAALTGGSTPPPPPVFTCGTSTVTYDSHNYTTVVIGSQCWFAENLRNDNYADGTAIAGNLDNATWLATTSGAQAIYGEGGADEAANLSTYGRLYNGYAVTATAGLCPTGWHVPTDAEWTALETAVLSDADPLKAVSPAWDGTNTFGFTGLPGGSRYYVSGNFFDRLGLGFWWTSTANGSNLYIRRLSSASTSIFRGDTSQKNGYSVRCVQD
jgi:uncharacterized protein (TIGR02145 family)